MDQRFFLICIADLRPTGSTNYITKYADDSSLLVPENHDVGLYDELQNVLKWTEVNKMQVNMAKTKEIVFHRLNAGNVLLPSELPGIESPMCKVIRCLAAGRYGHEETC